MKLAPLGGRVLVKPIELGSKSPTQGLSGLVIPTGAHEEPQCGVVVSAGDGTRSKDGTLIPLDVKAGDMILYGKYAGVEIKIDDTDHLIINQDEILGILTKET